MFLAGVILAGATTLTPSPAGADHSHFIYQPAHGNHPATCRYIANGQTSKAMDDPGGHAFHENVHTGRPGSDDKGTDFDKYDNRGNYDCEFVNSP
jgi:hypothetical protein